MKVAIYGRVSTEEQDVAQQIDYLLKWCLNNNFEVIKIVKDEESGTLPLTQRRKFLKLLQYSKAGEIESVVIYNLDRLTRNWDDVTLLEKHFRDNWAVCRLISTCDSIDLSNATGRLYFRFKMVINCFMPEDMREKQKIGIERAKREGKYKGGKIGRKWAED